MPTNVHFLLFFGKVYENLLLLTDVSLSSRDSIVSL